MTEGYILEAYSNMGNIYTSRRLMEEAAKEGMQLSLIGVHDTCVTSKGLYHCGEKLEKRDFLIQRYKWGKVKNELNILCGRAYNQLDAFNRYVNKFEQMKRLSSEYFSKPGYLLGIPCIPYDWVAEELGVPFVAKGLENSMGREILLIQSREDYDGLMESNPKKEWLFEEYISESYGRDLRIFSIRGRAVAAMTRTSQGDFRANVALGAKVENYPVTEEIQRIAQDIYAQTGLDFVGIDLLFGKDGLYFCEINVMPGIEGMETASSLNIAREMIRVIQEDLRNE